MNIKKTKSSSVCGIMNTIALANVKKSANSACVWAFHQPKFPEAANKFKKMN